MKRVGLADPVYQQTQSTVRLTLTSIPRLDPRVAAKLPRGSQTVLDALRTAGTALGTGDIADLVRLSRPATLLRLHALADAELIRWVGKSPKDPRAVWELTESA
jgi:ATP-dependent DNA helicase RecG